MDMDPAERGGVEWVSEFYPVKGSICSYALAHFPKDDTNFPSSR